MPLIRIRHSHLAVLVRHGPSAFARLLIESDLTFDCFMFTAQPSMTKSTMHRVFEVNG